MSTRKPMQEGLIGVYLRSWDDIVTTYRDMQATNYLSRDVWLGHACAKLMRQMSSMNLNHPPVQEAIRWVAEQMAEL